MDVRALETLRTVRSQGGVVQQQRQVGGAAQVRRHAPGSGLIKHQALQRGAGFYIRQDVIFAAHRRTSRWKMSRLRFFIWIKLLSLSVSTVRGRASP